MAKPFDPRKILKQISNPLLRDFFRRRDELGDVPWDDLTEHKIDPVFEAWQGLPEASQLQVQVILRDVNELTDHRGLAVLAEEILWRCPQHAEEFKAQAGRADKAMWVYLHIPEAFEEAALFARADALAGGRFWEKRNSLPKQPLDVDQAMTDRLAGALTDYYGPTQMRGRFCKIVHYPRTSGAEYFFAYLDDYPDKQVVFNDAGHPIIRSDRYAFENVFVYNSDDGSMESYAPGGRKVREPLEAAFCKAVLGVEVQPVDPLRPSYRLDHLLEMGFPLVTDAADGVEEARITRMRITPHGSGGYVEIKADLKRHPNDIYHKIDRWFKDHCVAPQAARVLKATFRLKFRPDDRGRQPILTFDVSAPNSCNLKSKPDDQRVVGDRCLKRWGVADDDE